MQAANPDPSALAAEQRARLEERAARCEDAARELEIAARHLRTAAQHYRDALVPRACAHILAAYGHGRTAHAAVDELAVAHASRSNPDL